MISVAGIPAQDRPFLDSLAHLTDSLASAFHNSPDTTYLMTLSRTIENMAYYRDERLPDYFRQFTDYSKQFNTPLVTGLYLRAQARVLDRSGQLDSALGYYLKAVDSLKLTSVDAGEIAMTYIYAAFLLSNSGSPQQCLTLLEQAKPYARLSANPLPLYYIYDYLGDYHYYSAFGIEDFQTALEYYEMAQEIVEKRNLTAKTTDNYGGLSNVYYRRNEPKKGDFYWYLADSIARAHHDYNGLYGLYIDKSEIFMDNGQHSEAVSLVEKSYEFARKTGWLELMARAQRQLYTTYRSLGNYEKALLYYEEFSESQDSMNKQELLRQYSELQTKYENERKEQLITELNNRNLRHTRNFLIGIIALGALLIILGIWTILRLNKSNKLLKAKNREILEAQIKGQTLERRRVASELHDNLNTKVAAIRWQLQALDGIAEPNVRKIIDNTLTLINDVYGDIRLIAHNLMPEEIEATGLVPALSNLVNQLNISNRVEFNLITGSDELQFPPHLVYPFYNISFELINNVLKHADAQHAWVSLSSYNDSITITVSDDGKGFDQNGRSGGVGLKNIRSRVENLGGDLTIESNPGKGTKTIVKIPFSKLDT